MSSEIPKQSSGWRALTVDHMLRTQRLEIRDGRIRADDVDERYIKRLAVLDQHPSELRPRCSMHNARVALRAHGVHEAHHGQWVDEDAGALLSCHTVG